MVLQPARAQWPTVYSWWCKNGSGSGSSLTDRGLCSIRVTGFYMSGMTKNPPVPEPVDPWHARGWLKSVHTSLRNIRTSPYPQRTDDRRPTHPSTAHLALGQARHRLIQCHRRRIKFLPLPIISASRVFVFIQVESVTRIHLL